MVSHSPEARRSQDNVPHARGKSFGRLRTIVMRVITGVFTDGAIHAGNLAYLSLMTLFPFVIVTAALAHLLGQNQDTERAVDSLLSALPSQVAMMLEQPINDVLTARTGSLLWLGGAVGLWTVASFIETIRDILRRAYGTESSRPFWQYRLRAIGLIVVAMILMMIGLTAQVVLTAVEQFVYHLLPLAQNVVGWLRLSRFIPPAITFLALYLIFLALTPGQYRVKAYPKWPGALFVTLWWTGILLLVPLTLGLLHGYTLTYGGLAGVVIALLFFWLIGYGLVIGAHLNAALAEPAPDAPQDGERVEEHR